MQRFLSFEKVIDPPTVMWHLPAKPDILNWALSKKGAKFTFRFSKCLIIV